MRKEKRDASFIKRKSRTAQGAEERRRSLLLLRYAYTARGKLNFPITSHGPGDPCARCAVSAIPLLCEVLLLLPDPDSDRISCAERPLDEWPTSSSVARARRIDRLPIKRINRER